MTSGTDFRMGEATGSQTFEEIVKWAYSTLPPKIRDLPDFPGIQVVDEPPADVLKRIREKRNWAVGIEMLGLYSGFPRRLHSLLSVFLVGLPQIPNLRSCF